MAKLIDIDEGLLRLGGNEQIFKTLLRKFVDNPYYESLSTNIINNNLAEAHHNAHTIKGTSGNLSLTALYQIATSLDAALKEEGDIQSLFDEFKIIYQDTMEEIHLYTSM